MLEGADHEYEVCTYLYMHLSKDMMYAHTYLLTHSAHVFEQDDFH